MITLNISSLIIAVMTASLFGAAPLTAYAQLPPLLQINPVNAAAATNSDDDTVVQANSANIKQKADVECEAKASDDDKAQIGGNINAAANDCDTTQTATVAQANVNTDNDVQVAEATACQAIGLVAGVNICDNVVTVLPPPPPPPEEEEIFCVAYIGANGNPFTGCFSTQEECEGFSEGLAELGQTIVEECSSFSAPPSGALCGRWDPQLQQAFAVPCEELS